MSRGFVFVIVEIGREEAVLKELLKIEGVAEAHVVYGVYDIICKIERPSMEALKEIVKEIRRLTEIRSTMTLIAMKGHSEY
ncbi:MAG: Lrp/AsnC family transcriptional regulator [Promethearchaeota archaeon]